MGGGVSVGGGAPTRAPTPCGRTWHILHVVQHRVFNNMLLLACSDPRVPYKACTHRTHSPLRPPAGPAPAPHTLDART